MHTPTSTNDLRSQAPSTVGRIVSSARTASFLKDEEILDSDDDDLLSFGEILALLKPVGDSPHSDDDNGKGEDDDLAETASGSPTNPGRLPPPSLLKSPANTVDDPTTSSAAATLRKRKSPSTDPPSWSPLYPKRRQLFDALHADTDRPGSLLREFEPLPGPGDTSTEAEQSCLNHQDIQSDVYYITRKGIVAPSTIANSPSREIADSADDGADEHFYPFLPDGQLSAKRRRRDSSASARALSGEVWTHPVRQLSHDTEVHADPNQKGEKFNDNGGQAQRIVGERQTPSGLEYAVRVEKKVWLPRAKLDDKLVRKYRAEQRAVPRVGTRQSSRLQKSSVKQRR